MSHYVTYCDIVCDTEFGDSSNRLYTLITGVCGVLDVPDFQSDVTKCHKISHIFDFLPESGFYLCGFVLVVALILTSVIR